MSRNGRMLLWIIFLGQDSPWRTLQGHSLLLGRLSHAGSKRVNGRSHHELRVYEAAMKLTLSSPSFVSLSSHFQHPQQTSLSLLPHPFLAQLPFLKGCCCCCCCCGTSVVSDSVQPHRWQPTRLPCPWDSPGQNTGVGCHFLLQCMKVKSESEVAQSCPTLSDPMDCSLSGSSIHGIFQARVLDWVLKGWLSANPVPLTGHTCSLCFSTADALAQEEKWWELWPRWVPLLYSHLQSSLLLAP